MNSPKMPEPSIQAIMLMLATQAMIDLGEIESPFTKTRKVDLRRARWNIDLLEILEDKTRGNLGPEEEKALKNVLTEVRMKWVENSE